MLRGLIFLLIVNSLLLVTLSLSPADYRLHDLEKFGVEGDDVMYAGLMPLELEDNDKGSYFYWHSEVRTESKSKGDKTPLVIWLNGGPGCSSNVGLFYENGPYTMIPNSDPALKYSFKRNPLSWTNVAHMVWVEQPLRTGFSVPSNDAKDPRVHNEYDVADDFHDFLMSFFAVFEHLKESPLYIVGESYGGRYVPAIAQEIVKRGKIKTLRGIGVGNGVIDPIQDTSYTTYAYSHGMIGASAKEYIDQTVKNCEKPSLQAQKTSSYDPCDMMSQVLDAAGHPNEFNTGTYNQYDAVFNGIYNQFFNDPEMQELIHVRGDSIPGVKFSNGQYQPMSWASCNDAINDDMTPDEPSSSVPALQYLAKYVRVLLYSGDLDLSCNIIGTTSTLEHYTWLGQRWHMADRALWRIEGSVKDVAGDYSYLNDGQFGFLVVHKSGHLVPMDRPDVALDLITRLVRGQSYADTAIPSDQQYMDMLQASRSSLWYPYADSGYVDITTLLFALSGLMAVFLLIRYHKQAFDFSGVNATPQSTPATSVTNTPVGVGLMGSTGYEMVSGGSNGAGEDHRGKNSGASEALTSTTSDNALHRTLHNNMLGYNRGYQRI